MSNIINVPMLEGGLCHPNFQMARVAISDPQHQSMASKNKREAAIYFLVSVPFQYPSYNIYLSIIFFPSS